MSTGPDRWALAATAAAALAVDPAGLGGLIVRDRAGPVRDALVDLVRALADRTATRLPGTIDPTALSDGMDLGATLQGGAPVLAQGVLSRIGGALAVIPMAERLTPGAAAMLAQSMDGARRPALVLLDEGAEPDETAPDALTDRLALHVSLEGVRHTAVTPVGETAPSIAKARARLPAIDDGSAAETLVALAAALGVHSLRIPLLALRTARALAAMRGAAVIGEEDIAAATALCLAPRATQMPGTEEDAPEPPPPEDREGETDKTQSQQGTLEDRVLDAVQAMLPDLALAAQARRSAGAPSSGAGDKRRSNQHGRPARPRPGKPEGNRLDVFATLLNAAPWQAVRRRTAPRAGLIVKPEDFRIKTYERPAESVLVFLVDASGSQAAARMAEAKGAVELMLSEAYRRREKVALIAFRGTGAEVLLPPTRSLLQAKRRLAVLPGGGPTPLAHGLQAGFALATQIRQRGATPYLIVLTDGRGNVALSGEHGRKQAAEDQAVAARAIAGAGFPTVLIDTANRPQADARTLAQAMGAQYLPLPRADAHRISRMARAGLSA